MDASYWFFFSRGYDFLNATFNDQKKMNFRENWFHCTHIQLRDSSMPRCASVALA